jgi:hypothetical protein
VFKTLIVPVESYAFVIGCENIQVKCEIAPVHNQALRHEDIWGVDE